MFIRDQALTPRMLIRKLNAMDEQSDIDVLTDLIAGPDPRQIAEDIIEAGFVRRLPPPAGKLSNDQIREVLELFEFDACDDLFWRMDDGVFSLYVMCSDFFDLASADLEEITPERLPILHKAMKDIEEVGSRPREFQWVGGLLYAARVRNRAPHPACKLDPPVVGLFPKTDLFGNDQGQIR